MVADVSLVGTRVGIDASVAVVVRSVAAVGAVDARVGLPVPDDTAGKLVADVSLAGTDVSMADVSPPDVGEAPVGVGLT